MAVFPARAGVILTFSKLRAKRRSLSRTSGGDPIPIVTNRQQLESFPHERG